MEHEEIPQLSFDDLLTNDDSSSEKPLEQIIRSNAPQTKPQIIQKKMNPTTGKPIFIHNLAQTIKTTQNGNQIISRVIKNDNGSISNSPIQIKTTATNPVNKKIIVLPAGKGQPVRVAGTAPGNVQLVRSGNNLLTLKGQVVKVVPNTSQTTSNTSTTNTQKVIPPGAIIIKSGVQKPQANSVTLKQVQLPKNVVKLTPNVKTQSTFQIKSVTTSNVSGKPQNESTTPTKYTIVRNSNGQQIKIIPHSQNATASKSLPIANIKLSPAKDTIIRSRPVPKEFLERSMMQAKSTEIPRPLADHSASVKPMVPPPPVNRVAKKILPGVSFRQFESENEQGEDSIMTISKEMSFPYEKKFTIKKERSPSPEINEIKRKHCNCSKSQCLKLYCDCFASGQFCQDCNCRDCSNNLEHEDDRQKAIKSCLERNPEAFKPKITASQRQSEIRLHNKGCNCKRSGCLKNYCECYEAKIACSSNCKCIGCKNTDDCGGRHFDTDMDGKATLSRKRGYDLPEIKSEVGDKQQPYNFITQEVIEASIQCMLAQAEDCKKSGKDVAETELKVIEEFGRCLVEIIAFSIKSSGGI